MVDFFVVFSSISGSSSLLLRKNVLQTSQK